MNNCMYMKRLREKILHRFPPNLHQLGQYRCTKALAYNDQGNHEQIVHKIVSTAPK